MITKLKIEGFKSIEEQEFDFKGLTVLTGLNSTGKSSVIQSILLLSHFNSSSSLLKEYMRKFLQFSVIRNRYKDTKNIKIEATGDDFHGKISIEQTGSWIVENQAREFSFEENLFYISSNRIGAEDFASSDEYDKFGVDGKYIFGYFEKNKNIPLDNIALIIDEKKNSNTLDRQLSYWLKYILEIELRLKTQRLTPDMVRVSFECNGLEDLSPFNVGAGNSYLAKVLIMGLSCKQDNILIVENPEIHLHPKAQSKLADFFVFLQNAGVQVIIETHCEHLISKLRYNVYKKKLESDDIVIYYKPSIQGEFEKISINSNGHFIDDEKSEIAFPSGFFDSTLSELLEIM